MSAAQVWIRTLSNYTHTSVAGDAEIESLLSQVSEAEPFVTLLCGDPDGDHTYFQVLGQDLDRLLVEGGGLVNGQAWHWRALTAEVFSSLLAPILHHEDHR